MHIRYFDLGAHKGREIVRMREILRSEPLADSWEIYGFEAHPGLARRCRWRFWRDSSVRIDQMALGMQEGTCRLYLNRNLVGSSIYAGKKNVIPGREVEVPCTRLSQYISENLPANWTESFNIIKCNIEGAEWDVWQDLEETGLVPAFSLWLGADEGHGGWAEDLRKVQGMEARADELADRFRKAGVMVYRFSAWDKNIPNSDIPAVLHKALVDRSR